MPSTDVEEPNTIWAHHDPDGAMSAYFTSFAYPDHRIQFVEKFGDTSGWKDGDIMVDMRPDNPNIKGLVLDHHLPHPEKHTYELISDIVPATLICWREFKDKIPKKEWWKLLIGLCGDGQPELTPTEVFVEHPSLMRRIKTSARQNYGRWSVNEMPIYKLMSSGINSLMRKGDYDTALNLIKYSDSPTMLYESEDIRIAKEEINNNIKLCILDSSMFYYDNLLVIIYYSKYRMSGYVASVLEGASNGMTVMAINKRNGSLSLRGDLATYYRDILKPLDYLDIDGHVKYMGGKLSENYHRLIKDLDDILCTPPKGYES